MKTETREGRLNVVAVVVAAAVVVVVVAAVAGGEDFESRRKCWTLKATK